MSLQFRMAARCQAAGRPNNEDNFQLTDNLATDDWKFRGDSVVELGEKGALLVVCDGMGGMNAGEVASDIAVRTIKQWFAKEQLTGAVLANDSTRLGHIRAAIQAADAAIKDEGNRDAAKRGMGSTAVVVWLLEGKAYVGWCGDSRAYKFNPATGLMQMSHDHSYVQELVDSGQLTEDLAFDHPNSNIITRSLGDPRGTAQPDVKAYDLMTNDVILLCSDGLCGVLRNPEIEAVMRGNTHSMVACLEALWETSRPKWHDNVTIALAQVVSCSGTGSSTHAHSAVNYVQPNPAQQAQPTPYGQPNSKKKWLIILCSVLAVLLVLTAAGWFFYKTDKGKTIRKGIKQKTEQTCQPATPTEETNVVENKEIAIDELLKETEFNNNDAIESHLDKWEKVDSVSLSSRRKEVLEHLIMISDTYGESPFPEKNKMNGSSRAKLDILKLKLNPNKQDVQ